MGNPVVVITGAASGIGLALSEACAQRNMQVVMVDKNKPRLDDEVARITQKSLSSIMGLSCDVADASDVRTLAESVYSSFDGIDILFNNAGIFGDFKPLWELTDECVREVMDVNLFGVFHGAHSFLPYMFKQKNRARIVNIASLYGLCSSSQVAAYAMSKHAILALSESLYFDLKRLNKPVDVSVVFPSFANTQLISNSLSSTSSGLHDLMASMLERSKSADDVAQHILQGIEKGQFYILPDKEVKAYCEQRTQAIVEQTMPARHNLEKVMDSLCKRAASA